MVHTQHTNVSLWTVELKPSQSFIYYQKKFSFNVRKKSLPYTLHNKTTDKSVQIFVYLERLILQD